jgi:hypothetical protein
MINWTNTIIYTAIGVLGLLFWYAIIMRFLELC